MPVLTGGQVLDREGTTVMPCDGGALLEGGLYNVGDHGLIEEAEEPVMGMGPYKYSGVPPNGYKNGIAEKGAYLVDILTGDTYRNTGTKAATVWEIEAASGGGSAVPEITLRVNPGAIGDTAAHDYSLLVNGSGDADVFGMVGAWTNNENGDLCPPEDGVYELTTTVQSTQSAGGPIALRVSINSASSAYAVGNTYPYIPAIPDGGSAQPVIVDSSWYGDPPVVGPDRSLGGLRVQHLIAASAGAAATFLVRIRKIGEVAP